MRTFAEPSRLKENTMLAKKKVTVIGLAGNTNQKEGK